MRRPAQPLTVIIAILIAGFLMLGPLAELEATTVEALGASDLVARAERILHVVCEAAHSRRMPGGGPVVTRYRFRVVETLKGPPIVRFICEQPGGRAGRIATVVPGLSAYRPGDESIIFWHGESGRYQLPVGLDQGVYRVVLDPESGTRTVRRAEGMAELELIGAADVLERLPVAVTPERFKEAVRARVAAAPPTSPGER